MKIKQIEVAYQYIFAITEDGKLMRYVIDMPELGWIDMTPSDKL